MCMDMGQTMPEMDDEDGDGPTIAIVLQAYRKRAPRPGDAAKQSAEKKSDPESDENDDLVDLVESTRGDSKPPAVMKNDLPKEVSMAMGRKKGRK